MKKPSLISSLNSTTVRINIGLRAGAVRLLQGAMPRVAARIAAPVFFTPPRPRRPQRGIPGARVRRVAVGDRNIMTYTLGSRHAPRVYLLHGWGGAASQMRSLAAGLAAAGWQAIAIDAPAHGASSGRRSSLVDFARTLRCVVDALGPAHAVIGHSMGGPASAVAIRDGLAVNRLVFISSPADPGRFTQLFASRMGLSEATLAAFRSQVEHRNRQRFDALALPAFASAMTVPLAIIHDANDREVPIERAYAIVEHWPGAELTVTHGLGHGRILHNANVVEQVVSFIGRRRDIAEALDRWLFEPHAR